MFTLDYVCMDGRGMKKVVGASILEYTPMYNNVQLLLLFRRSDRE